VASETVVCFFLRFNVFKSKTHDFLRFLELLHTFSRTLVEKMRIPRAEELGLQGGANERNDGYHSLQ